MTRSQTVSISEAFQVPRCRDIQGLPISHMIILTLFLWTDSIRMEQKPRQHAPTFLSYSHTLHYIDRPMLQGCRVIINDAMGIHRFQGDMTVLRLLRCVQTKRNSEEVCSQSRQW